jgi:hypothetical protein
MLMQGTMAQEGQTVMSGEEEAEQVNQVSLATLMVDRTVVMACILVMCLAINMVKMGTLLAEAREERMMVTATADVERTTMEA